MTMHGCLQKVLVSRFAPVVLGLTPCAPTSPINSSGESSSLPPGSPGSCFAPVEFYFVKFLRRLGTVSSCPQELSCNFLIARLFGLRFKTACAVFSLRHCSLYGLTFRYRSMYRPSEITLIATLLHPGLRFR